MFDSVDNIEILNTRLNAILGVISTSLFVNKVSKVIIASEKDVRIIQ